jgi:hypothetical protein
MAKSRTIYERREFLNEELAKSAFVIASLEAFSSSNPKTVHTYPTLDFADCSQKVMLDFCFYGEVEMKRTQAKLAKLVEVVTEFKDAFDAQVAKYEQAKLRKRKTVKNVKSTKKHSSNPTK